MKKIRLNNGQYALVDNEDFEYLNKWKWYFNFGGYAQRDFVVNKIKTSIRMHRLLNNTQTWQSRIRKNWKTIYLGCFKSKKDAIKARKEAEQIYHQI